jgi:hypothetical protein
MIVSCKGFHEGEWSKFPPVSLSLATSITYPSSGDYSTACWFDLSFLDEIDSPYFWIFIEYLSSYDFTKYISIISIYMKETPL